MNLKELQSAWRIAESHKNQLTNTRDDKIATMINEQVRPLLAQAEALKRSIHSEVGREFSAVIEKATTDAELAKKTFEDAQVSAKTTDTGWLPVGTKVFEWENRGYYFSRKENQMARSGKVGVIEVWSRDSLCPDNLRYSLPHIGEVVVRLLKKDGTPSTKYVRTPDGWKRNNWLPEGVEPPLNKKAAA